MMVYEKNQDKYETCILILTLKIINTDKVSGEQERDGGGNSAGYGSVFSDWLMPLSDCLVQERISW